MVCWWLRIGGRPFSIEHMHIFSYAYLIFIYIYLWNVYIHKYPQVIPFSCCVSFFANKLLLEPPFFLLEIGGLWQQARGEVATMASLHSHVGCVSPFDVPRRKDEVFKGWM